MQHTFDDTDTTMDVGCRPDHSDINITHSIVEAATNAFASNPKLPFARFSIPRGALVVPTSVPERIVEAIQRLPVDRHRNETGLWSVGDPRLDFTIITVD